MKALAILILLGCACASVARVHLDSGKAAMAYMVMNRRVGAPGLRFFFSAWGFAALALLLAGFAGWLAGRA